MARKLMIAGNWKLNKTVGEALELVRDLRRLLSQVRDCEIVIAPPYTALYAVGKAIEDSPIDLAAQELFWEDSGAYTGTVSAPMLAEVGCKLVLVGHSERRQFFNETLESSGKRAKAALKAGLRPILCIGETLKEREANRTMEVVAEQLDAGIQGLSIKEVARCVIAYEPVWAIGTGKVATPAQAQEVHAAIRERLRAKDNGVAESMQILYGGSMKPDNAAELLGQADIDGGLIGGASLTAESFAGIVKARK
ncbi:MAG: triose-phosphate isomerase [Deltaproteobacteria bacterium RIFOXYA12_FULL_58_15]|nr:MAG: triose-phosphate isomerase [Deltaproteobacteria bacterium RIFOXYA12_FULL_58_15]